MDIRSFADSITDGICLKKTKKIVSMFLDLFGLGDFEILKKKGQIGRWIFRWIFGVKQRNGLGYENDIWNTST